MWAEDLRVGDQLVSKAKSGVLKGRFELASISTDSVRMCKVGPLKLRGREKAFSYQEVEETFLMPKLDLELRFGQRALLLIRTAYDDGRISLMPWIEGKECPFDGGDGVTFEFLGMVDARAGSLDEPDLWAHKEELVAGTFRFMGEYPDPPSTTRATNPDIDDRPSRVQVRGRGDVRRRTRR